MHGDLVSTGRIARELHVSEATVRSYAEAGLIPCVKTFGGHRRFPLDEVLEAWEHRDELVAQPHASVQEISEMKPIEISAAWKNDWVITAVHAEDDDADHDQQVTDLLRPEPFPGVHGKTRFVVSRLVGV